MLRRFFFTYNRFAVLLSYENIAHYLLEKGLVNIESIIKGEFSVRDLSSRNVNFAINQENPPGYLVKQVRSRDREKFETLRIEATCYWLANNDDAYQMLKAFLPGYYEYDYLHHILVLELMHDVKNLNQYYSGARVFPTSVAEKLAELLASYHTHTEGVVEKQKSFSLFKKQKPWVFSLTENHLSDLLDNASLGNAEKQSVKLIAENQEFIEQLRIMRDDWETKSLIHGDVKFANFLINNNTLPTNEPDIRLIDWELADIGDPIWDVAAVVQNYLTLWVSSEIAMEYRQGGDHLIVVSLEHVQPSIAAFWERYSNMAHWNVGEKRQRLEKMVRYTALKLVHSCFESVHGVKDMSLYSAKMLQLSLNLLLRPDEGISEVLGIQTNSLSHANNILSG